MSQSIDRRAFMQRAAGAGAALSVSMAGPLTRRVLGANERVRVGVVGTGRQGIANMKAFQRNGAEIAAVCDVYGPNLEKGALAAGSGAKKHRDFRALLDQQDVDVVVVATPDHWHALPTILACQAKKDVYVEKPVSVAVSEGKAMVVAARKHERVVQVGLWQRSNAHFQRAAQIVREGLIGEVTYVRTWNYSNTYPDGIGNPADCDPPADLDWDMWLGPAPAVPFNWNRFGVGDRWSTFRYFYDYANGWLGDWAVHLVDIVQWALDTPGPAAVSASGAKLVLRDNSETPDTLQTTFEFPTFVCTYENRLGNATSLAGRGYGIEICGTLGTLFLDRAGFEVFPEKLTRDDGAQVDRTPSIRMARVDDGLDLHVANMLECVKSRQHPAADIEAGHRSSATCLLGNVALRTRERIEFDPVRQELQGASKAARNIFTRAYRAPWSLPA